MVQHVVAYAAQQRRAHRTASAPAHDHHVVLSRRDLIQERQAHRLGAQHGPHGNPIWDPVNGAAQDRLGLVRGVAEEVGYDLTAHADIGDGWRHDDGAEDGQAGVLAIGQVDRLLERLVGVG